MSESTLIKTPAQLLGERRRPKADEVRATMNAVGKEVYDAIAKQHAAAFNALHTEMENDLVIIHRDILEQCEVMIEARTLHGRIRRVWAWLAVRLELVVEEIWHREYYTAAGERRRAGVTYGELLERGIPHPDGTPFPGREDELCDGSPACDRADEHCAPEGTAAPELVKP